MGPIALHALCAFPPLPSARIRVLQLAPHLAARGLHLEVSPYPRDDAAREAQAPALARADLVLVHRELPRRGEPAWLRSLGRPLVFDFDDALMLRREKRWRTQRSLKRALRFRRMLSTYDAAICGNAWLAARCAGLPTLVSASPVPVSPWTTQSRAPNEVPAIGWIGLSSNLSALALVVPALAELAGRRRFRLVVLSDRAPEIAGVEVVHVPWSLAGQERDLAGLDIGIMPLALDDPWSRGKCAYKLLQSMAAGLPVVASDVGMNREVVEPEKNGFLARTQADWVGALERLLDDRALRERLGAAGRARVERDFTYERTAERWAVFLGEVAATARR